MTSLGTEKLGKGRELSKGREERLVFDILTSVKGTVCIKQCLFLLPIKQYLFVVDCRIRCMKGILPTRKCISGMRQMAYAQYRIS